MNHELDRVIETALHGRDGRALGGRGAPIHEPRVLFA